MITTRLSAERGSADHGWLRTHHSFSFADYYDPKHMGFRSLRVINEDFIAPQMGFGTHGHRDMEIISYVVDGTLAHKDSMGNVAPIPAGEVQYMSAGSGVRHSEFNHEAEAWTHMLQIWIIPSVAGAQPRYAQAKVSREEKLGTMRLIASGSEEDSVLTIRQDARLYASILNKGDSIKTKVAKGRGAWVQVIRGAITVNGFRLAAGDGAAIEDEPDLEFVGAEGEAEFLYFDLA